MRAQLLLQVLLLATAPAAQTTCEVRIDAQCVDHEGKPVAGVEFGDTVGWDGGKLVRGFLCPNPTHPLRLISDADGRVNGTWTMSPMGTPLFGSSRDHTLAVFVLPSFDDVTHEACVRGTIAMQRAVTLRCTLRTTAPIDSFRLVVSWPVAGPQPHRPWFAFTTDRADFALTLPPGR
ncbi:MAG: hypothetical protein AB7I19_06110 [Planctomycetota bacterium]